MNRPPEAPAAAPLPTLAEALADAAGFVARYTAIEAPSLVPELRLHLAGEVTPLWEATERELASGDLPPPFWAFAWAGGQALARLLFDRPSFVAGRTVLDVGTGSGLVAIAAMRAGAHRAVAADLDPVACAAVPLNAALNGVIVETIRRDVTAWGLPDGVDMILVGDVCYERDAAERLVAWLAGHAAAGIPVLVGDPGRTYLPKDRLEPLAEYAVPTPRELEDQDVKRTRVWRFKG